MEGYKPLCLCVLQLDNDRRALVLRSLIVLNVSPFNKIKGQFLIVYLLLRRQVHIFYELTIIHGLQARCAELAINFDSLAWKREEVV